LGNSLAITIPKSWVTNYEKGTGQKVTELALEVNGILKISPVFEKGANQNGRTMENHRVNDT
jgi:antitoxin component of MazEF toxin-antitoxin module